MSSGFGKMNQLHILLSSKWTYTLLMIEKSMSLGYKSVLNTRSRAECMGVSASPYLTVSSLNFRHHCSRQVKLLSYVLLRDCNYTII